MRTRGAVEVEVGHLASTDCLVGSAPKRATGSRHGGQIVGLVIVRKGEGGRDMKYNQQRLGCWKSPRAAGLDRQCLFSRINKYQEEAVGRHGVSDFPKIPENIVRMPPFLFWESAFRRREVAPQHMMSVF